MTPSVNERIIIEEIDIIKFGKFNNYTITADDGLNIVCGGNESGKSTIQLFLKGMLYGLPSRKRSGEIVKERERAIPWGESFAEGVLKLRAGERRLEIRRRFGKTAAGDRLEVCDSVSGESIAEYSDGNVGEIIFGVPCEIFEKTMWIRQSGVFMGGADEQLAKRLTNLQASGDEGVSAESALKLLEQERLAVKAKDGRNAKGRIDVLLERREECIREKYALETQLAQTEATERRTDAIRKELSSVAEKLASAEEERKRSIAAERSAALRDRLRRAEDCERRLAEIRGSDEYIRSRGLTDAEVKRARELEDEIRRLGESEPSGDDYRDAAAAEARLAGSRKTVIGGAALAAAGAVGAVICLIAGSLKAIAFAILLLVGLIFLFFGIRTAEACKNIIKTYRLEKQKRDTAENEKRQRAETLTAELGEITKRFGAGSSSELAELYAAGLGLSERERSIAETLKECLGGGSLDELRESAGEDIPDGLRSSEELNELIGGLQRRQNELTAEISALESKLAYDTKITRIPADIDTELASIGEEIAECERRLNIISIAEDGIKEAADIWKSSVTPQINERVNEIVSRLTGGRYDAVRVTNDYRMRVEASGGLYNAEYLSCGTYEQLYLALRVAVAELICGGGLLFLDDALVAYDDERTAAAVGFLSEYAENRQIFLFTCHGAAAKTAKSAKIIELQI